MHAILSLRAMLVRAFAAGLAIAMSLGSGAARAADPNYQGLWWNSPGGSESGWGLNVAHQGDVIFATWFTYDAGGKALWLSMTASKATDGSYAGTLVQTKGPAYNAVPFNPSAVTRTDVGTGTLRFADAGNGSFAYTVNGVSQSKSITRQQFGELPACAFGGTTDLALATNYQDLWWVAGGAESGWGVNLTHQGDTIFATWFTYDTDGSPLWLSATAAKTGNAAYAGTLYRTSGPAFSAVPFDPAKVSRTAVGSLTLAFANGNSGTFAWTINGAPQSKAITRQVFRSPGTVCGATSTPTGPVLSDTEKRKDAARFLRQATYGVPREAIDALVAQGYDAWLNEQFAKPLVSHLETYKAVVPTLTMLDWHHESAIRTTLYRQRFEGEDQLRQRVADALSQIFVVSMLDERLRSRPCVMAAYLDVLNRGAFGNFRDLLKEVTLSPAMGTYLSMKQSAKADPAGQTQPDENFAREVMQLFAVGLVMLNEDGTTRLGTDGKPIPTFNEDIVKGYARALSGWTLDYSQSDPYNWIQTTWLMDAKAATAISLYCEPWSKPMKPWLRDYTSWDRQRTLRGPAHDQGTKPLMVYTGAPVTSIPAGQSPEADLENVLDNLFYHPNVGPFIGRQLIQRLVTSNPSPAYVARVARKFNDNGAGARGDMKAIVRAILTDDEARNLTTARQATFGKLTEPHHRFLQMYRVFKGKAAGYDWFRPGTPDRLGQDPLAAPSVFNFYRPEYSPTGPLAQNGLVGPEFEITTTASIPNYANFISCVLPWYGGTNTQARCVANDTSSIAPDHTFYIGLANNPAQLVDELDLVLCAWCLDPTVKAQIAQTVGNINFTGTAFWGWDLAHERLFVALWLIMNSPDYLVQK